MEPELRETVIDCPRCYEPCGWCSDYRHMHGTLRMPNHSGRKRYCDIPAMAPEGDECPICHGDMKVVETRSYARVMLGAMKEINHEPHDHRSQG